MSWTNTQCQRILLTGQQPTSSGWTSPLDCSTRVCGINRQLKFSLRCSSPLTDQKETPLQLRRSSCNVSSAFINNILYPYKPWKKSCQVLRMNLWSQLLANPAERHNQCVVTVRIWVVHHTGVFDLEVLYCICTNAAEMDEQLLHTQMFPPSFINIETVFTTSVSDKSLMDNLECKTTDQQYFSKLQSITNQMFPDTVPVCYTYHLQGLSILMIW